MNKRIIISILYWIIAVLLISAVLSSLKYEFPDAFFISLMLIPGCIVMKFVLPTVSFSSFKKGLADIFFISAAVMVTELLFLFCTHIAVLGLSEIYNGHANIPSMLINPAFIAIAMAFITGGDYLLSRYLKKAFSDTQTPIVFTSDYKKVSLNPSEILYVESRDTEVWVCAAGGSKFRNKTGITQWENLLGEDFIRVHRSFVVRKESIHEFSFDSLTLSDGTSIPVSRKYRETVSSLNLA
ncbi:MAG: LytTR family transcriptional regulator [Bacteroidales bacterium]|nr:LytTR family transcriptional regulator [Bacteroidales bacterium]